jgi:hypothetical protein
MAAQVRVAISCARSGGTPAAAKAALEEWHPILDQPLQKASARDVPAGLRSARQAFRKAATSH